MISRLIGARSFLAALAASVDLHLTRLGGPVISPHRPGWNSGRRTDASEIWLADRNDVDARSECGLCALVRKPLRLPTRDPAGDVSTAAARLSTARGVRLPGAGALLSGQY